MKKIVGYEITTIISVEKELTNEQTNEMLDKVDDIFEKYGFTSIVLKPLEDFDE